jgi:acyl transferase domain-containing protein
MEKLAGSRCGVFVGSFNRDYKDELQRDPEAMPLYHVTGTEQSMLANRISYVFDFRGPSISLDTACSASMTHSVWHAKASIRVSVNRQLLEDQA